MSTKIGKTEPLSGKDLKQSPAQPIPQPHDVHPKDVNSSPIGAYSSMFQRHGLNVPQPPQHIREEELRRYVIAF